MIAKKFISCFSAMTIIASCIPTAFADEYPYITSQTTSVPAEGVYEVTDESANESENDNAFTEELSEDYSGTYGNLEYKVTDNKVTITGHIGNPENVTIPEYITLPEYPEATKDWKVVAIADKAFYGCRELLTVSIPNGVTTIGTAAFRDCSALYSISLPDSVEYIGPSAFRSCQSLVNITLPKQLTIIEPYTFNYCQSLTYINIPSKVSSIGDHAFTECRDLKNVTISSGVTKLGDYAFAYCSNLSKIDLPNSVSKIGDYGFRECYKLSNVSLSNNLRSLGAGVFSSCSSITEIIIPSSLTSIPIYTFAECRNLKKIVIPNSVKLISYNAFTNALCTIYCYKGSYAEEFAKKEGKSYQYIIVKKPQITSATPGNGQISLKWSASPDATFYAVYSRSLNSSWTLCGTTKSTEMCVTGLTNNIKYGFAVKAYIYGSWTDISSSDIVYATPTAAVEKPKITKAEGQDGQVALNWTAVSGATNYAVYTYLNGTWSVAGYRTATGMYVRNLANGTKYGFAVKAYVNGTWSSVSSSDIVYATPISAAAKPVITKAQGQNGRVALNWTAVNGATNYAVYTYLNGKWSVAGYRTETGMYVRNLTNGTTYGFAVKAYVNGAWTNITSADIVYATPTAAKSDLMDTDFYDFSFLEDNGIDFVDVAPTVR